MSLLHRFSRSDDGNVAIIFALAMIPIISCAGMGVDYTLAGRRQSSINAIADAAALSTTTPAAMALTSSQAQTNAQNMFNAQISGIIGINFAANNLVVTVTDTVTSSSTTRNTTVTYTATSKNTFSGILRMPTMAIGGVSKASNTNAPNIDFYLLIDTSPSMGIPSSQSGINTMVAATPQQSGGCAFACHESNASAGDVQGNPKGANGQPEDNYALARQLGVTLRMDLVQQAAANLISTAASTEASNKAVYRVATYTFDANFNTITNLTPNLTLAQSGQTSNAYSDATTKINMLVVANDQGYLTPSIYNNDEDTNWDGAMAYTPFIPAPGNGTKAANDTPKEILFIVTDGVADEAYPNLGSTIYTDGSARTVAPTGFQNDWCTPLKNRGIRIAILYTTYNPLPNNSFYNSRVGPFQSSIGSTLNTCASSGLFFQVDSGGDINAAMQTLFSAAVASAHLTQ